MNYFEYGISNVAIVKGIDILQQNNPFTGVEINTLGEHSLAMTSSYSKISQDLAGY